MKNIAVIGAGTMGNGIAHTFAQHGYNVNLIDISEAALERGMATITRNLDRMIAKEKISEADKNNTLNNINTQTVLKRRGFRRRSCGGGRYRKCGVKTSYF